MSDAGRGVICHITLAVTPERLLGLLGQRNQVRNDDTFGALPSHKKRTIDDNERLKRPDSARVRPANKLC